MKRVSPTPEALDRAAALLRSGGIVAIPTETVYGVAANAFDARAVARIFEVKGRPAFDPLIVHVGDANMLAQVAAETPPLAQKLIEHFWPGPLTLVLPKAAALPELVTSGLPTVAVRMPAHPVARRLLERAGVPLAAPSANAFGRLSPTRAEHVERQLGAGLDLIVDAGPAQHGIESTIVALVGEPRILRAGAIPNEEIASVIGAIKFESSAAGAPLAPGQLPRHYAPRTLIRIVESPAPAAERAGAGFVGLSRLEPGYAQVRLLSERGDLREAAARLFAVLHELDELGLERIDVEPVAERGLGVAIMDRLRRAERR